MAENLTVLERCNIQPSVLPENQTLPLSHFDMAFLFLHRVQRLLFFEYQCSKSQLLETIVPNLKKSLAQALAHFPPLAGKIICPLNSGRPFSRIIAGDSVSLTIAETKTDITQFTGNHPRLTDDFYIFLPQLPAATRIENDVVFPVLALQITLFPGRGLCFGITKDHGIGDASSIVRFIKLWAEINRSNGGDAIDGKFLPVYDRTAVEDSEVLDPNIYWQKIKATRPKMTNMAITFPVNKFRSTFVLSKDDLQKLKLYVLNNCRPGLHVTAFTVTCALVWSCLVQAEEASEAVGAEVGEFFYCVVDCRGRMQPPLPAEYFGNCLVYMVTETVRRGLVMGEGGFAAAVELIGGGLKKRLTAASILEGVEEWPEEFAKRTNVRSLGVVGSPKFDLYEVDYGWGGVRKFEQMTIDGVRQMSVSKSRVCEGGLEIGLSGKKETIHAFSQILTDTLHNLPSDPLLIN
ncbi:phenolic glucoside malonyltransferase 1-like [Andrographis paniculata]|uniref:phenolic glucoside malonyltransferase 1-like n=1 Tax=Andrographis paniculata TaxID=175694 RepID=UPI0021E73BCD|nr:phenolic glucoside malonyltransferase 1-like [Andrographis paniculata]